MPCITPGGRYWVSVQGKGRLLSHTELARLQGLCASSLRKCVPQDLSGRLVQDLVGNAFPAPVIGAVLLASLGVML